MAENYKKTLKTEIGEVVIVTFVEDLEQAKEYEALLKNNDIPVMIKEQEAESENSSGIAIFVPEDYLDEAHVVIESQDAYDDFYDFSVDEDTEEMFDEDIFDEEF